MQTNWITNILQKSTSTTAVTSTLSSLNKRHNLVTINKSNSTLLAEFCYLYKLYLLIIMCLCKTSHSITVPFWILHIYTLTIPPVVLHNSNVDGLNCTLWHHWSSRTKYVGKQFCMKRNRNMGTQSSIIHVVLGKLTVTAHTARSMKTAFKLDKKKQSFLNTIRSTKWRLSKTVIATKNAKRADLRNVKNASLNKYNHCSLQLFME